MKMCFMSPKCRPKSHSTASVSINTFCILIMCSIQWYDDRTHWVDIQNWSNVKFTESIEFPHHTNWIEYAKPTPERGHSSLQSGTPKIAECVLLAFINNSMSRLMSTGIANHNLTQMIISLGQIT